MIKAVHHFSLSVTDMDRTIDFYSKVLGLTLQSRSRNKGETLGEAVLGMKWGLSQKHADLELAVMTLGDASVEFIEYRDPKPPTSGRRCLALRQTRCVAAGAPRWPH